MNEPKEVTTDNSLKLPAILDVTCVLCLVEVIQYFHVFMSVVLVYSLHCL